MTKRMAIAGLALLLAVAAVAQPAMPPGKWWRRPEIVQMLNLSEDQQKRLETIFRSSANDLIDLRGEVEKLNIALRGLLDQSELDRNTIRRTAEKLNESRGRLFERELMMLVDMRTVLNEAQWNRMRNELDRLREGQQQRQQDRQRPHPPR
jgi:hypothetical protein